MKRVVFVDQEADHSVVCGAMLEYSGYRVHLAISGDEAVDLCRRRAPDLVLLELSLPGETGYEVLPRLRAESGADCPVVAFTPSAGERDRVLRAGFAGFVSKPCDPGRLLALVERLIGPPDDGRLSV